MAHLIPSTRGSEPSLADSIYATDVARTGEKTVSTFVNSIRAKAAGMLVCRRPAVLLTHRLIILSEYGDIAALVPDKISNHIVVLDGMGVRTVSSIANDLLGDEERFRANLLMISFHLRERDDFGDAPDIMADYNRAVASAFHTVAANLVKT